MLRMLVRLKLSLSMTDTVTDVVTCIIPTWLLSRFVPAGSVPQGLQLTEKMLPPL